LRAVVGLGNPGREYLRTRHNAGFTFIKRVAKTWGVRLRKPRYLAKIVLLERGEEKILLAMPQTYMNRSGLSIGEIARHFRLEPERILVVYDDFALPLGEIRVRKAGSAGSHNGMVSIISELETERIPRIRIGIGPLPEGADAADFVLTPFSADEGPGLESGLGKAEAALDHILNGDIDRAMTLFN